MFVIRAVSLGFVYLLGKLDGDAESMERSLCSVLQTDPASKPDPSFCDPSFIHIRGCLVQSSVKCKESETSLGSAQELQFGALSKVPLMKWGKTFLSQPQTSLAPLLRSSGVGKEEAGHGKVRAGQSLKLQELGGLWVIPQLCWDSAFPLFDTLIFPAELWAGTASC